MADEPTTNTPPVTQYEYLVEDRVFDTPKGYTSYLNDRGTEGWNLILVRDRGTLLRVVFSRQKPK